MTSNPKNPVGRPKMTIQDLHPNWKENVFNSAENGGLRCDFMIVCAKDNDKCLSNDLWVRLMKEEPEFSETINKALQISKSWWVENGRKGMWGGKQFNPTPWHITLKNAFGSMDEENWTDRQDVTTKGQQITIHLDADESNV